MRDKGRASGLLLAALALACAPAEAQIGNVFTRTGSGARAAGMANAFIAVSDDGTAASWNPAGLGQLRMPELSFVTTTNGQTYTSDGFRTRDDLSVFSPARAAYASTYVDFASLAVPATIAHKPVTFQASWRRLYTLDFRQNFSIDREPLQPAAPPRALLTSNADAAGGISLVSFAAALKLTPRLALGAGFNVWRGDWTENEAFSELVLPSTAPAFRSADGRNRVRGRSVSLGLMLTFPRWSVGLLHLGPLRGDFSSLGSAHSSRDPQPSRLPAVGRIHFPQALGFGAAWRPAPRWTVAFDLTWDEWSRTTLDLENGPSVDLFNGLPPGLAATRNTLSAAAGAERLFHGDGFVVPLRFGAAWVPQGPRSPYTRDPVNFVMLAAGTGYNTNSLKFDAAFQYRWAGFRDGSNFSLDALDSYLPEAVGERDVRSWIVKLSVIVRITDTDKLRGTLRRIFGGG